MDSPAPRSLCSTPAPQPRALPPGMPRGRARAISQANAKWVNGTVLRFCFLEGAEAQQEAVRTAFATWRDIGIGLGFEEVDDPAEAEIRIAFADDGSWSYIGTENLTIAAGEPTMNFGWDLTDAEGAATALHEIGHALGMPHEHQNPFAGIVWDEDAVYAGLGGPPNNWSRETTFQNILRKLSANEVDGSDWDPDSIMEYPFGPGMIVEPAAYRGGVTPPGTISALDRRWMLQWYPGGAPAPAAATPFLSVPLAVAAGGQVDLSISPPQSRSYTLQTFGAADTVMILFEDVGGAPRYLAGTDDSGTEENASLSLKLFRERRYTVRIRLGWAGASGGCAFMFW